MGDNKITLTYKLDGTESKNTMMGRGGTPMESVSTAKWDGSKLVITTKAGRTNETTQTWSLAGSDADGREHGRSRHARSASTRRPRSPSESGG